MKRNRFVAVGLVLLFGAPLAAQSQNPGDAKPSLVEKVLRIADGSIVTAELRDNETLSGRIGEATKEGFRLQYARSERVYDRNIAYDQVKSIGKVDSRSAKSGMPTVQESVLEIAGGSLVDIRLKGGERALGYLGTVSASGFTVKPAQGAADRELAFSEVASIAFHAGPISKGAKAAIGVVAGFFGLCLLLAVASGR